MNVLPHEIVSLIDEYLIKEDHLVLALTCKQFYWEKWDIVGCYTLQLYDIEEEEEEKYPEITDDFVIETWYKEEKEIRYKEEKEIKDEIFYKEEDDDDDDDDDDDYDYEEDDYEEEEEEDDDYEEDYDRIEFLNMLGY
jgi:hypothetical protein